MSVLPPEPWHTVHIDFNGPLPTGDYLLVTIDAYSRYPEVDVIQSTAAKGTIEKLMRIFATHGIPKIIKSDNGPPFTSHEFKVFMEEYGINHQRITPLWPQANSEAERFMKPLMKAVRSAHVEGRDWHKELYIFLLNYRSTPHATTGVTPAQLLFNRQINMKIPQLRRPLNATEQHASVDAALRERDGRAKMKMKLYADRRRRAQSSCIKVGDVVLLRQKKMSKFSTKYDPEPFQVVRMKGTMATICRSGKYLARNVSLLKKVRIWTVTGDEDWAKEMLEEENGSADHLAPAPASVRRSTRARHTVRRYGQNIYEQ